jgi:hypothetical protein
LTNKNSPIFFLKQKMLLVERWSLVEFITTLFEQDSMQGKSLKDLEKDLKTDLIRGLGEDEMDEM